MNWQNNQRCPELIDLALLSMLRLRLEIKYCSKAQWKLQSFIRRYQSILILDEPTTVFDPNDAKKLFENLGPIKKGGMSIIYISVHLGRNI
jgi:ribose transport system ATP-binding protein